MLTTMSMLLLTVSLLFLGTWSNYIWCMQIIPERAGVVYLNPKYVEEAKFYVRRYSRRSNYYLNLEGTIKQEWNNNVTCHFIFYEYLHNEYKRSFVEMHNKVCDMINKDPYIGGALSNAGLLCPIPKGKHIIQNITIPVNEFPNVWPFEKSRVEVQVWTSANESMAIIESYIYFKNRNVIPKYYKKSPKSK